MQLRNGDRRFNPERVLLTRLSAVGDCILTIPLAVEIKQLWPNCTLTWAVESAAAALIEPHPAVDEVLTIEKGWLKRPMQWLAIREQLRDLGCDLALDPQGLTKSSMLGWLSGARCRVGHGYSHGREIAPLLATKRVRRAAQHMVDTYRELLSPWTSIQAGAGRFDMPVYDEAASRAEQILNDVGLGCSNERWVAINPGAGWTTRIWPVQRFGMLARELFDEYGCRSLVFWAGESENLMARVVAEESRGTAMVAPTTDLPELLELVRRATLMVTGDTGPMHVASSVGTPCVSLHGVTWSDECGPYGNPHVSVQSPLLPLAKKLVRRGPNIAMQAIEIDEVQRACRTLLDQPELADRMVA